MAPMLSAQPHMRPRCVSLPRHCRAPSCARPGCGQTSRQAAACDACSWHPAAVVVQVGAAGLTACCWLLLILKAASCCLLKPGTCLARTPWPLSAIPQHYFAPKLLSPCHSSALLQSCCTPTACSASRCALRCAALWSTAPPGGRAHTSCSTQVGRDGWDRLGWVIMGSICSGAQHAHVLDTGGSWMMCGGHHLVQSKCAAVVVWHGMHMCGGDCLPQLQALQDTATCSRQPFASAVPPALPQPAACYAWSQPLQQSMRAGCWR